MFIKVINPKKDGKKRYNNTGSCVPLVNYLSKEDKAKVLDRELYFSHERDMVTSIEVIRTIDSNAPLIDKHEAKFYSLVIAPRPDEMQHHWVNSMSIFFEKNTITTLFFNCIFENLVR